MIHPQDIVDLLNDLLESDPAGIEALVKDRILVNEEVAEHPHVVVSAQPTVGGEYTQPMLGVVGLLNGVLGDEGVRLAYTAYTIDGGSKRIKRFMLVDDETFEPVEKQPPEK